RQGAGTAVRFGVPVVVAADQHQLAIERDLLEQFDYGPVAPTKPAKVQAIDGVPVEDQPVEITQEHLSKQVRPAVDRSEMEVRNNEGNHAWRLTFFLTSP